MMLETNCPYSCGSRMAVRITDDLMCMTMMMQSRYTVT